MGVLNLPKQIPVRQVPGVLAEYGIDVTLRTVHRYIETGQLKARKRFGKVFVGEDQIMDYIMGDDECQKKNQQSNDSSTESDTGSRQDQIAPTGSSASQTLQSAAQIARQRVLARCEKRKKS